jgi:hypothetical protein
LLTFLALQKARRLAGRDPPVLNVLPFQQTTSQTIKKNPGSLTLLITVNL